jgi:alkylation response protein AidB-like acyl-CoA dehydrogenase
VQGDGRLLMALIDCSQDGVRLGEGARFLALDGTRTCSVTFRDALVPRSMVLADDALPFIARIKAGFILLQCGMALGLIAGCVELMRRCDENGPDTNRFLEDRPETFAEAVDRLTRDVAALSETPLETSRDYMRRVLETRLAASEWSLRAAQAAMLHAGARGYLAGAPAQRRLRESYFIAIVTPATKHLRRELACLEAGGERGPERPE